MKTWKLQVQETNQLGEIKNVPPSCTQSCSEKELTKWIFPCEEKLFILLLGRDMGLNVVHFKWLPANYYCAVSDRTTLCKEWIYDFVRVSEDSDSMPERKKKKNC